MLHISCLHLYFKEDSNSFVPVLFSVGFCCIREEDLQLIVCSPILFLFVFCPRGFFGLYFGVGSSLTNQVTFSVVLYNPEIGQEPP